MELNSIIKEIGRGKNHARDIDADTAYALYQQMLAGNVPELEMGAILIALRIKGKAKRRWRVLPRDAGANATPDAARDAADAGGDPQL